MTSIAKIIEVIGSSEKGWEEAAQAAVNEAKKTIHEVLREKIEYTAKSYFISS